MSIDTTAARLRDLTEELERLQEELARQRSVRVKVEALVADVDQLRGDRDKLAAAVAWLVSDGTPEGLPRGVAEAIDTMCSPLVPIPGLATALAELDRRRNR